jgi:hypothetical protein
MQFHFWKQAEITRGDQVSNEDGGPAPCFLKSKIATVFGHQ